MRQLVLLVVLISMAPLALVGAVPIVQGPAEWIEPSSPAEQAAIAAGPDYQRFLQSAPGRWRASFDPVLGTPRAVYGSGIALVPETANRRQVESAVLQFLEEHSGLFGAARGDFAIDSAMVNGDLWIIAVSQQHNGTPVQGAHLSMAIKKGRLILVQGVTHRIAGVGTFARLGRQDAVTSANRGLGLGPRRVRKNDSDETRQVILPLRTPGAVEYRLTWEVRSRREDPNGARIQHIVSYVDAMSGDVLAAQDGNRYGYSVNAAVQIEERTIGGAVINVPAPFLKMTFAGAAVETDESGSFTFNGFASGPQPVTAPLRSRFVTVDNLGGGDAAAAGIVNENAPFSLLFDASNSDSSERMTFAAINRTNRFVAPVFPDLAWLDTAVPAVVNINDQCNAFSDGSGVFFFRGGSICNATGRIFDIVAHEWGHALDFNAPGDEFEGALSEFIGDLVAFTQTDDSRIGPGFFVGSNAPIRDLQSASLECFDSATTEVHDAGQMLGAVVWDIREDLKAAGVSADEIRRLMLLPIAIGQTRSQWYLAMLAADDDDGDLSNGTPHECLIHAQFEAHSCNGERWIGLPPASSITASPSVLWPANRQMVPVDIEVVAANSCSASSCRVTAVTSNEPVDGPADWIIDDDRVLLRAERSGRGSGRIYTIHMECTDAAGHASPAAVAVTVPHDPR